MILDQLPTRREVPALCGPRKWIYDYATLKADCSKKVNHMSRFLRSFPRRITTAILWACCGTAMLGLGMGGCIGSQPAGFQIEPTLSEAIPPITEAGYPSTPPAASGEDTLAILQNNRVPAGDWRDEAIRLKGIPDIPEVVSTAPARYAPGDSTDFYVTNTDTRESRKLTARLVYQTENVYFFVEQGIDVNDEDVKSLVDEFQSQTYPTNREFFGSEWIPGVDGDPHMYMLYARGLGQHTQAYCDSVSEFSSLAHPYSNEKEIIALNVDAGRLNDSYWRTTLAHEFQHMIHWYQNRNAETWLNEGASMLAESINGFDPGSKMAFLNGPDLQLNSWVDLSSSLDEAGGHYDAAYLFMQYFLDRFGSKASQTLVANRATGIAAVDSTLATLGLTDPVTGEILTAEDVFADWAAANFLNDSSLAQGQCGYKAYAEKIPGPTDTISDCPTGLIAAKVHQFGTRYIELTCQGEVSIYFSGSQQVSLAPTQPHSGRYAMWSSREDESDTTLTREFDLSQVKSASLDYWAWWKIESDYDYAYLEVSADGGKTWKILPTPSGTDANPAGSNLGWGYTGCSGGGQTTQDCSPQWIHEQVDLSAYAGNKIQLRFEYLTDAALDFESLLLDDISVPEIGYTCSFENDTCGWDGQGFARVDNVLPQRFVVQLIHQSGGQTTVERLRLDANRQGSLSLDLKRGDTTTLVVSGTTPFTTEEASFELEIK
jgi:immune inhibitor A